MKKYKLTLNKRQVENLLIALDFYSRVLCGQLKELETIGNGASEDNLRKLHGEMFPKLCGLHSPYGIGGKNTPESAKICYDIYKKIMFEFNPVGVYAYKPFAVSKEGFPEFEVRKT